MADWFLPEALGVESNQFQELLADEFDRQAKELGRPPLPIWCINNTKKKELRIRRLGAYLSRHELRFRADSPGTRMLVNQMREFPLADHDDGPDALEMAIRLMGEYGMSEIDDSLGDRLQLGA